MSDYSLFLRAEAIEAINVKSIFTILLTAALAGCASTTPAETQSLQGAQRASFPARDYSCLTVTSSDGKRTETLRWNGGRLTTK